MHKTVLTLAVGLTAVLGVAEETLTLDPSKYTTWSKNGTTSVETEHDFGGEIRPAYRVDVKWQKGGKFQFQIPVRGIDGQNDWPTHEFAVEQTQKGVILTGYNSASVRWDGYTCKDLGSATNFTGKTLVTRARRELCHMNNWSDSIDVRQHGEMSVIIPTDSWDDTNAVQTVWCSDVVFTKDDSWKGTERDADWRRWQAFCDVYEPDYSDSLRYLEPPVEGRLAKPLALVKEHAPYAEIIAVTDVYGSVALAARDLQHWIAKITGATLPIAYGQSQTNLPVKIWLNSPSAAKAHSNDVAWLRAGADLDGYFVRTKGNEIFIGCAVPSDTTYENAAAKGLPRDACPVGVFRGAIAFLENNAPIIFACDDREIGTVYDESPDFTVRWGDGRDRPATCGRGWLRGNDYPNHPDKLDKYLPLDSWRMWYARIKCTARMPHCLSGHGFCSGEEIEFFPKNEERFRVWDGEKRREFNYYKGQVCLSAPDAVETAVSNGVAKIDRMRGYAYPIVGNGFWNEDNYGCCICDGCTQPIAADDGTVLTSTKKFNRHGGMDWSERIYRSTQYMQFVNRLADGIAAARPGVKTEILAYLFQVVAPKCKVSPNVAWTYAPYQIRASYSAPIYCPVNNFTHDNITEFLARGGEMHVYDYQCFGGFTGANSTAMEAATEDFRWYAKRGAKLIGSEFAYLNDINNPAGVMNGWLYPQTGWFADLAKLEQLRKYYLRRVYREGAPIAERYFGGIRRDTLRTHAVSDAKWVNPLAGEKARGEWEAASAKIANPIAKKHFEILMKKAIGGK